MLKNSQYEKVKKQIQDGIWKTVKLVQVKENGQRITIVHGSKTKLEQCLARLEFIRNKHLAPGEYVLVCASNFTQHAMTEEIPFTVSDKTVIQVTPAKPNPENKTEPINTNPEPVMPNEIDFEEYKELLRENATLKAQNEKLLDQLELYRGFLNKNPSILQQGLSDAAPAQQPEQKNTWMEIAENFGAPLLSGLEEFFHIRNRELDLAERKMGAGKPAGKKPFAKKKKEPEVWKGYTYTELVEELENMDDESFDHEMTEISEGYPELYEDLIDEFFPEGEEEQEEEEEQQPGEEDAA